MAKARSGRPPAAIHKVKFVPLEDARLVELVGLFGDSDWGSIANHMPNRTVRQCRERWLYFLTPSIRNGPWSAEDDALLLQKFEEIGSQWKAMTRFFPGRTEINIKNHYAVLLRRRAPFSGDPSPKRPAELVAAGATPNTGSTGFFDDLFPELSSLLWDFHNKEAPSASGEGLGDMEYGF
jgi:hypothetical protein